MASRDLRIAARIRNELDYRKPLFSSLPSLNSMLEQAQELTHAYNSLQKKKGGQSFLSAGKINAVGVLHTLYQSVVSRYLVEQNPDFFTRLSPQIARIHACQDVLAFYAVEFPSPVLMDERPNLPYFMEETARGFFIHQVLLENTAVMKAARPLLNPPGVQFPPASQALTALMGGYTKAAPRLGEFEEDLYTFLTEPARLFPDSLENQIAYVLEHWQDLLPEDLLTMLLRALDAMREEDKIRLPGVPGPSEVPDYKKDPLSGFPEHEAFSADSNWMPNVVLIAKSTLVWLDQLSREYGYPIKTLDAIPDRELDVLVKRGFTGLWLIGLWERSNASKRIKNACGNPEAQASAYSLKGYDIASAIGGWQALDSLNARCRARGLRLASDMVPNHTGLDSDWVLHHPDLFISTPWPPFPSYSYHGMDLSDDPDIEIKIDDHYYDRTDAAVTFRRTDKRTRETQYIFHGNDGTSMPWNDTAQLDFLNPSTREAVIQQILHVARSFSIIRFDAAMTLARKHVQRLWYPKPGSGGDVPGRSACGLDEQEFDRRMPQEFWREVVDRIAAEQPDTLLLAEAFWMMEGYFVRTLGMHRVYNSAFMNMLKNQENKKYRDTIKNTIAFDPEILKRFVNFMNNPDEETAVAQFGDGDRYFGICTLLATMPGLPMFGHGQIEGFKEKYGMEYSRAYWDEKPDSRLIQEHERRIFPLLRMRRLFSSSVHFQLFDMVEDDQPVESVYAYVNGDHNTRVLVLYNNQFERVQGRLHMSEPKLERLVDGSREVKTVSLAESLMLKIGGRRFLVWNEFTSGLTYMVPSITVFDEGLWTSLEGYQTKVFIDIREIEDFDGSLETLCKRLAGDGTRTFEEDVRSIRLEALYKALENFRSPQMLKMASGMTAGSSTAASERKYLLLAGEAYARLTALMEAMDPAVGKALGLTVQEVDPLTLVKRMQRLVDAFKADRHPMDSPDRTWREAFQAGAVALHELPLLMNAALLLMQFVGEYGSIHDAQVALERLQLGAFFHEAAIQSGIAADRVGTILTASALLAYPPEALLQALAQEPVDPTLTLKTLLESEQVRAFIKYNEYDGIVWYRKESFQEMAYLLLLGAHLRLDFDSIGRVSSLLSAWLRMDSLADYRIDRLLGNS